MGETTQRPRLRKKGLGRPQPLQNVPNLKPTLAKRMRHQKFVKQHAFSFSESELRRLLVENNFTKAWFKLQISIAIADLEAGFAALCLGKRARSQAQHRASRDLSGPLSRGEGKAWGRSFGGGADARGGAAGGFDRGGFEGGIWNDNTDRDRGRVMSCDSYKFTRNQAISKTNLKLLKSGSG